MGKILTVKMPDIGEGVVEGEVISWLKNINDLVKQDEPVVIVMTDKATVELPSPSPGKLVNQYYKPGQIAIKDKPLYDIELEGETEEKPASPEKVLASPATRKLAKEMNLDIQAIQGTGKEGRVTKEDLKSHGKTIQSDEKQSEVHPLVGIRLLMAKRMAESKAKIPHFSYFESLDASRLIKLHTVFQQEALKEGIHVTFMPFFIKALSMTILQYPEMNSSYDAEKNELSIHKRHHIGIAMATELGLIVPVLKGVEKMSLQEIIMAYESLKAKAKNHQLSSSDMKEATITISNYGVLDGGGSWATPIINFPESAILALGRIQKRPFIKNEELVIRDVLNLSWSFDHRILDGSLASKISHTFSGFIQNPAGLL